MRKVILINVCVWMVLLLLFTTAQLPGARSSLFLASLHNAGHGLAMCFAALLGISTMLLQSPKHTVKIFCLVPLALLVLSVLIEVVQFFIGRGASEEDIVMDVIGIASGTLLGAAFFANARILIKMIYFLLGILFLAFCLRLPAYYFIAPYFAPSLPVLANFDNRFAGAEIKEHKTNVAIDNHSSVWSSSNGESLKAEFLPGRWPYIRLNAIENDWSAYRFITLDVFNAEDKNVRLNVRLDYDSTSTERAFMIGRKMIPPGHSRVTLSFHDLSAEYYGSEPDFTRVKSVMFYLSGPESKTTLYFDNIGLR